MKIDVKKQFTPVQFLLIGFVIVIIIGSILLSLPFSSATGTGTPFIDALFTATSAVTTTGLIVVDTGSYFSHIGEVITLILFQIGGLGYMIFAALLVISLRGRISFHTRMLLRESLVRQDSVDIVTFSKAIILLTLFWEILGAVFLTLHWMQFMPITQALYAALYHSVSAFCTAGFSLFSDSLSSYGYSVWFNVGIDIICIAGGIGFFVLYDVYDSITKRKKENLQMMSTHTKFTLLLSAIIMTLGTVALFLLENGGISVPLKERTLDSLFQAISASTTTGFNTIDIGAMNQSSLFIMILLMFVGAAPGGTGGGIKITTFGLLLLIVISILSGKKEVNIFKRRISYETIKNTFNIFIIAILWISIALTILCITEKESLLKLLFEEVSAFGTVGLSTGITPSLSTIGKVVICISMLIGRIGPLAIGYSILGKPKSQSFKYPKADILVG